MKSGPILMVVFPTPLATPATTNALLMLGGDGAIDTRGLERRHLVVDAARRAREVNEERRARSFAQTQAEVEVRLEREMRELDAVARLSRPVPGEEHVTCPWRQVDRDERSARRDEAVEHDGDAPRRT